jgi:diguanylate cyclase (GGDEF)-like protein
MAPQRTNRGASTGIWSGRLALRDPLTGLLDLTLLADRVDARIAAARRNRSAFAILYADIDHLDCVNDTRGRVAGDDLLREVASRMERTLRASDAIARVNGDEFAVLLDGAASEQGARRAAERLGCACRGWYEHDGVPCAVALSIGIAQYPRDGAAPETLLQSAQAAMYYAKTVRQKSRAPVPIGTRYSLGEDSGTET